jgi:Ca-activated chloride channel family protein
MDKKDKKQPPISNMEERKWQKKLNQRGVNTLMLPIRKGENKDEKPW